MRRFSAPPNGRTFRTVFRVVFSFEVFEFFKFFELLSQEIPLSLPLSKTGVIRRTPLTSLILFV